MSYPKIIYTDIVNISIKSRITVSGRNFVELIKNDGINTVFSAYTPRNPTRRENFLYIIKEGFYISVNSNDVNSLEELYDIRKNNFENFYEYLEANYFNIKNRDEYRAFKESKFWGYQIRDYIEYLDAKSGDFDNKNDYIFAKSKDIKNRQELNAFRSSGFSNYSDYLIFKTGGFKDKKEFGKALTLGFKKVEDYHSFIEKRLTSRMNKLNAIVKDANFAYDSNRFGEFIRLKYLCIDKMADLLYLKLFDEELKKEDNLKLNNIFEKIERKLNIRIIDYDELDIWRRLRNKIAHEHTLIKKDKADKCKGFLGELFNILMGIYEKMN